MKVSQTFSLLAGATLCASLLLNVAWPARAAWPAAPLPQSNLLNNGGLDSFQGNGMASGWEPWWEEAPKPASGYDYAYKPEWAPETNPAFVQNGSGSQHVGNRWDPWRAGIRQTISAPAGSVVRITAYGRVFASTPDWPAPSDGAVQSRMQIGADPNGSIEWYSSNVKWSGTANPHDTWAQFTLDVTTGAGGKVTIFLSNNFRGDSRYHIDAWWDNVSAVVVGQGSAATSTPGSGGGTTAQPTRPPFVSPTPGPDGSIVYTVQSGDTLFLIAYLFGVTVDQIKSLNGLTSDIIVPGQRLIVKTGAGPTATPTAGAAELTPTPTTDASAAVTNTPAPTIVATSTPQAGGVVCALIWNDANGNSIRDSSEGLLAGGQLTVVSVGTGVPVQAHTTDGLNEPHCFQDLAPGQYTISAAAPTGHNPTNATSTSFDLKSGDTLFMEFGAQPSGTTPNPPDGSNDRVLRTALLGAAGVMFLLLAIGVGVMLFMRRR